MIAHKVCVFVLTLFCFRPLSTSVCCLTTNGFLHLSFVWRLWTLENLMVALNMCPFSFKETTLFGFCVVLQQKTTSFWSEQVCIIEHAFWWSLATFRSWASFIIHRIWQILGECLYKTNLKQRILNEVLNANSQMSY